MPYINMNKIATSFALAVFFLFAIGLIFLTYLALGAIEEIENTYPSVENGQETLYYDWKYKNNSGILVNAINDLHCYWKPDNVNDGYKRCEAIIEIENLGNTIPTFTNFKTEINLAQHTNKTPIEYYYSDTYSLYNQLLMNRSGENLTEILLPRRAWTNWIPLSFLSSLNPNSPFAIKAVFEIPQYEANHYAFYLNGSSSDISLAINLDPPVSECGTLNTPNEVYTLTQDVSSTGTCFTIVANNITLNGSGYTITYGTNGTSMKYGVHVISANTTTIKNARIIEGNSSGGDRYAIYLSNANNGTVKNNTIITIANSGFFESVGVRVTGVNATIIDNNITTNESYGMDLWSAHNSYIANNYIVTTKASGIILSLSNSSTIVNNTLRTSDSNGNGIWLSSSSNNTLINNNIETTGNNNYGIYLIDSHYSHISGNDVTTSGNNSRGIYISTRSSNNVFSDHDITTSGRYAYGIYLWSNSGNNNFIGMAIKTNGSNASALYISDTNHNFTMSDSIINASDAADLFIASAVKGGEWNFTNTTFTDKTWGPGANGTLNVHWWLDALANYSNGLSAPNVNISAWNKNNVWQFSVLTKINGRILRQRLLEYKQNNTGGTNITYYSNYTFNATRPNGKENLTQSWNMTTNRFLVFTFDATPPNVTLISPEDNEITKNTNITFICNATDNKELKNISLYFSGTRSVTYIKDNAVWKYNDSNVYPGENWFNESFNDTTWPSGAAYLGIETSGITTTLANCAGNACITYYFRKNFTITNASKVINMSFNIDYDDAYIVYINGKIINSSNLSCSWTSHGTICTPYPHDSLIDNNPDSPQFPKTQLNATHLSYLVTGINYIAVAIKQGASGSSDIAFKLRLEGYEKIDWHLNQTKTITGIQNLSQFNLTLEDNSTYKWNCLAYDAVGNSDWGDSNFTLTINSSYNFPPEVILQYPPHNNPNTERNVTLNVTVTDPEGSDMNVTFFGREKNDTPWTLVALPDTQKYVNVLDSNNWDHIFKNQTNWVKTNKSVENITFVTHEGDIVENRNLYEAEWISANESMSLLDKQVPYGVLPGNHDITGDFGGGNTDFYNKYFPVGRYSSEKWWGGNFSRNDNNYEFFSAGGVDYIIIHLEFCPTTTANRNVLAWASDVLKNNTNRSAIITTHGFLYTNVSRWVHICESTEYIWDNLIYPNNNTFLVLSGHVHGEARRTDNNIAGRPVHQILANYQSWTNGGNGFLRRMKFIPSQGKIEVKTYSPYVNQGQCASLGYTWRNDGCYKTDDASEFTLDDTSAYIGRQNNVQNGTNASILWQNLNNATTYKWYVEVMDNRSAKTVSPPWNFTTIA